MGYGLWLGLWVRVMVNFVAMVRVSKLLESNIKGALYRIYQVRILCRRFPAKFPAIVSPALVMHDSVHRRDLRGSG